MHTSILPWIVGGVLLVSGGLLAHRYWRRSENPLSDDESNADLEYFYPATATGRLKPGSRERVFWSRGPHGSLGFIGDLDGRMIPIEAKDLSFTEGNIFTPRKIEVLVEEASKRDLLVYPGYGDVYLEKGNRLHGAMRDGNHRASAAIQLGAPIVWILLSDSTKHQLDEAGLGHVDGAYLKSLEKLYRAIRKAQKAHGAPLFQWKTPSKLRASEKDLEELVAAESQLIELEKSLDQAYRDRLKKIGFLQKPHFSEAEQLQRASTFVRMRIAELREKHGRDWMMENVLLTKESEALRVLLQERTELLGRLDTLRTNAGLNSRTEHLDPVTKKVFRRF